MSAAEHILAGERDTTPGLGYATSTMQQIGQRQLTVRSTISPHITPEEWRWVIIFSGVLVSLTLIPLAWALAGNAHSPAVQFMGLLVNPQDGLTYLAKMEQGFRGNWLFHLSHTPESHDGAAIFLFYLFLGHVAQLLRLSPLEVFHIARVLTALFMYFALYQFGASVWTRARTRRLFFALTAVGSGLGWLVIALDPGALDIATDRLLPDLTVPEAFPFYAAFAAPHFPFAIGLLALIGSIYIAVFRPGHHEEPTFYNRGLFLAIASLLLAIVMPQALVPICLTLAAYLLVRLLRTRRAPLYEASWAIPLWFTVAPFAVYYFAALQTNPALAAWGAQNVTPSPPPQYYLASFGPLLLLALPGLGRALRRFEPDGDQFMLTWLVVNAVLLYLPTAYQRRLVVGLVIPLAYFAVRAFEDYWRNIVPQRLWRSALILVFVVIIPSNVFIMAVPLVGAVANTQSGLDSKLLLETDYANLLAWIRVRVPPQMGVRPTVILASPDISLYIPGWGGPRVVYGHPYETVDAERKRQQVEAWYRGEDCTLPDGESWDRARWRVDYIVLGPRERALSAETGSDVCYADLGEPWGAFGDVAIYRVR